MGEAQATLEPAMQIDALEALWVEGKELAYKVDLRNRRSFLSLAESRRLEEIMNRLEASL